MDVVEKMLENSEKEITFFTRARRFGTTDVRYLYKEIAAREAIKLNNEYLHGETCCKN